MINVVCPDSEVAIIIQRCPKFRGQGDLVHSSKLNRFKGNQYKKTSVCPAGRNIRWMSLTEMVSARIQSSCEQSASSRVHFPSPTSDHFLVWSSRSITSPPSGFGPTFPATKNRIYIKIGRRVMRQHFYDPSRSTSLHVDASRLNGLGLLLKQRKTAIPWRLVQAGYRFLSSAEIR